MTTYVQGNTQHRYDIIHGVVTETLNILGDVGVGHAVTPLARVHIASNSLTEMILAGYHATDVNSGRIRLQKSRGTRASPTIVSASDEMGGITWSGYDGAAYLTSARILALVDGTPGTNDMPGALTFAVAADGAATVTERMRINAAGQVLISDGTSGAAGLGFISQPSVGLRRVSATEVAMRTAAGDCMTWVDDVTVGPCVYFPGQIRIGAAAINESAAGVATVTATIRIYNSGGTLVGYVPIYASSS